MVSPAWCFQIDRFLQKKMGPDWPFFDFFLFFRKNISLNIIQSMKSSLFIFFAWKLTKHAVFHHFHTRILFIPYYKKVCIRPENELLCWTWVKNESRVIKTSFLSLIHVIVSVYRGGQYGPLPYINDLISQSVRTGWPVIIFFTVLFLKVANINFRKSQVASAYYFFKIFDAGIFQSEGAIMAPSHTR